MDVNPEEKKDINVKIKAAVSAVAATPDGLALLRYLFQMSGYDKSSIVIRRDGFDRDGMIWNEARRAMWIELKALMSKDMQAKIEIYERRI